MRLPNDVIERVERFRVDVFYADRGMTRYWNRGRSKRNELRFFCGWYWLTNNERGRASEAEHGPFNSKSAAIRDAFERMHLRSNPPKQISPPPADPTRRAVMSVRLAERRLKRVTKPQQAVPPPKVKTRPRFDWRRH